MAKYDAMGDRVKSRVPVALWIMLLGLVIGIVGFIWCMNTDLKKYTKTENLYADQDTTDIKNLDFEFDSANVTISPSSDKQIHVSIEDAPEGVFTYGQKDSTFYIHRKNLLSILKWSGISDIPFLKDVYPEAKINVQIPEGMEFDSVNIECSVSEAAVKGITCEKLTIENGMGTIKLLDCKAEKTDIDNGMGKVEATDSTLGKTDIDNGMGLVKLSDCELDETDVDNGMGKIDITADIKGDIDIDNGMGGFTLRLSGSGEDYRVTGDDVDVKGRSGSRDAKYKISVDNGMGDVDIIFD